MYKNVYKNVFINGYEQLDIIEDYKIFLNKIEKLKPYIIKFDENSLIKPKVYLLDYAIGDNHWQPIIVIIYNEYIFFSNNSIQKTWA